MKRLDTFVLSKFLQLFTAAFFVCLFVFMMQFMWRYVDDLVGKGLTLDLLAQFFGYMALTLIPQSLPMAVLLASLITFGNMGESLELLSMKAAGVSLARVMRPLIVLVIAFAGLSFYFQNNTGPEAQKNLRQLLISIRQSQPAVEIPEGIFYNEIPQLNVYVERKNVQTGMLYNVIFYMTEQGVDKAKIVVADSAHLELTSDKMFMRLSLWSGCEFEDPQNMLGGDGQQGQGPGLNLDRPFARQRFSYMEYLKDFDSNFTLMDSELLGNIPSAKNMHEIVHDVDSMNVQLDSAALAYVNEFKLRQEMMRPRMAKEDSVKLAKECKAHPQNFDAIVKKASAEKLMAAKSRAKSVTSQMKGEVEWKTKVNEDGEKYIRRHWVEWHTKITLSLACILFFFVGAPLGAIIRKGGLGLPAVISVMIFIFYYIINTSGMKMAREGNIDMFVGMWLSTMILTPAGVYLTFMANRDSQVFNIDAYRRVFRKIFGLRVGRNIYKKEVIIETPDYAAELDNVYALHAELKGMRVSPLMLVNYLRYRKSAKLQDFGKRLDDTVANLANSTDLRVLKALNEIPVSVSKRHLRHDKRTILKAFTKLEKRLEKICQQLPSAQ